MTREAKLAGFVLLLILIFASARLAGSHVGPVTTSHAQVGRPGPGGAGGMTMGPSGGGRP